MALPEFGPWPDYRDRTTFETRVATNLPLLGPWGEAVDALAIGVSEDADAVAAAAVNVAASEEIALAASNFKGAWASLSGALNIPAAVFHKERFWILLNNVADITLSEPNIANSDWLQAYNQSGVRMVASGAIGNGDIVVLNEDGTVSAVTILNDEEMGTAVVFNAGNTSYISASFDSYNNKIVIAYRNSTTTYGTAIVGTVSGTSISFGTAVVFNASSTTYTSVAFDSYNKKVVIAYSDISINYGKAIVGTVSGTSISFGTAVVFTTNSTSYPSASFDSYNNKIVIAYRDSTTTYGTAIVGTVSGTSISFGTAVVFNASNTTYTLSSFNSYNNKVVIAYTDVDSGYYGKAIVGTVSGTSISFGTAVVFNASNTTYTSVVFDSYNNKVVIAYKEGTTTYGTVIVGTVSGTSISFGTKVVFTTNSTTYISASFDSYNNKVVITYQDTTTTYGTAIVGTVSGTAISFGTPFIFESAASSYKAATFDSYNNKVVIAYADDGNGSYGTAIVYQLLSSTVDSWVGISANDYINSQEAIIYKIGDVAYNQTGLTIGATYYLDADGSLTLNNTVYGKIGKALSATKLLITEGNV